MNPLERLQLRGQWAIARLGYGLSSYRHPARSEAWRVVRETHRHVEMTTTPLETAALFRAVRAVSKVPGDMAEAGVYRGGTALIMLAAAERPLHLFDTFAGLPSGDGQFAPGDYTASIEEVRRTVSADRALFHPGLFPASAVGLEDLRFAFVHLDLDLYESTRDALEWFWPRLNAGGILLSHDYPLSPGVVRAFDEFFADRPEPFVPLSGNQALAVKP